MYEQPLKSQQHPRPVLDNSDLNLLYDDDVYTAYTEDLEFMWRWSIYRENNLLQEGCSLTRDAANRAVRHVLTFFKTMRPNGA